MANKWKCPYCPDEPAMSKDDLIDHIDQYHREMIPEGWTASRLAFKIVRKKDHGTCVVCKGETEWNEKRGKYQRLCNNPQCRKALREQALKNHIRIYKVPTLLNDMEHQDKMLKGRHISGEYTFRDGGKISYVGSFEKKFLEFMDTVLECDSKDIMEPGPVLEYNYNGKSHKWITDFLYIPYNLIIEVKDGGDNPNKKTMEDTRAREKSKDKLMTNMGTYNYLKLTNNNFRQLMSIFADLKQQMIDDTGENKKAIIHINENVLMDFFMGKSLKLIIDVFEMICRLMPNILDHPKIKGKPRDQIFQEVLSGAYKVTKFVTAEFLVFYFFVFYIQSIELLTSLIVMTFDLPFNTIGWLGKYIKDKITHKENKQNILPLRTDNLPKGYSMFCFNTHPNNFLVAGFIQTFKLDLIKGNFKNYFSDSIKIPIGEMLSLNQWDARDFFLLRTDKEIDVNEYIKSNDKISSDIDVVAVNDGVVVSVVNNRIYDHKYAEWGTSYISPGGNCISIMHSPGNYSFYGHLKTDSIAVSIGDKVKQGDVLGKMGNTGNSTGAHLHFELNFNSHISPLFNMTLPMTNFKFKSIDIPMKNMFKPLIGNVNFLNEYKDKAYKLKQHAWIPELCFIKEA